MRICILAEGCYPYVAGGVSSWIQMLIKGMPEHEFVIVAIGAQESQRGKFKYEIPENVTEIIEYFLDTYEKISAKPNNRISISKVQKKTFLKFLQGESFDWKVLFDMFGEESPYEANQFLESEAFLDIVMEAAEGYYLNTPFTDTFWTLRSMLLPVLNLLKCPAPRADIYHSVATGYAGVLAAKFRYRAGSPFILTEHGIYTREREEEILKADWVNVYFKQTWIDFFHSLCMAAYESADRIVSLFYGARRTQIALGAPEEKCSVIPNGINMERFAHIREIPEETHPLSIGAVIRVVPIKDIKTMIYSFSIVKQERPDALLYLIGPYDEDPEYYDECLELIENLQTKDIVFTGRVNVAEWFGRLDLVILTSVSEGQPFVLLEAMASRRPVLSTNVGSCQEIIEGFPDEFGKAGEIAPVMNPSGIARGILKIGKDVKTMRAYAENGNARVRKYYQESDFLTRYRILYEEVGREWQESGLH